MSLRFTWNRSGSPKTYSRALDQLDRMRRGSTVDDAPSRSAETVPNIHGMDSWLDLLGYAKSAQRLRVLHVAGTNGKGSTCAFIEALLAVRKAKTGYPRTIGVYTSPHLISPRERIRINGEPLSETLFAQYFTDVHACVEQAPRRPRYLQMLMLMSVHAFVQARVDVAVYETHSGGEYNATNVFRTPVATGITSIGMDHIDSLGPTLNDIAWHKGGISKAETPTLTVEQDGEVLKVLRARAKERNATIRCATVNPTLAETNALPPTQKVNFSLSIALTDAYLQRSGSSLLTPDDVAQALTSIRWAGRFQRLDTPRMTWYLDCAHNEMGLVEAARWFGECSDRNARTLIFAHFSRRNAYMLLKSLHVSLCESHVNIQLLILTTYQRGPPTCSDTRLEEQASALSDLVSQCRADTSLGSRVIRTTTTIAEAVTDAVAMGLPTLVTGSHHLVGGVLHVLS